MPIPTAGTQIGFVVSFKIPILSSFLLVFFYAWHSSFVPEFRSFSSTAMQLNAFL